jgi:hypothetical protein
MIMGGKKRYFESSNTKPVHCSVSKLFGVIKATVFPQKSAMQKRGTFVTVA